MNIRNIFANIKANEHAVSPVVATFILIIVAVVGAAVVGAMMGVIGEDVGAAADADRVGDASRVLIQLGACGCEWERVRAHVVDFTAANAGIGVLRHDISCQHNPYAVSKGIADVGLMGTSGRGIGFIVQAAPPNATLDAFVRDTTATVRANITTLHPDIILNNAVNNSTAMRAIFTNATITGAEEGTPIYANFTVVNAAVVANPGLQTNWATYLRGLNVREFPARMGDITLYYFTLGDPSPTEQLFINYMRLMTFA